jgi:hypothetical protein
VSAASRPISVALPILASGAVPIALLLLLRSRSVPVAFPIACSEARLFALSIALPLLERSLGPPLVPKEIPLPRPLAAKPCVAALALRGPVLKVQPLAVQFSFKSRQAISAYIVPRDTPYSVCSLWSVLETHAHAGKVDADSDAYGLRFSLRRYDCERQSHSQCT